MNNTDHIPKAVDYRRAYALLKRINEIKIDGAPIHTFFVYEGYDFWHAYQTRLFVELKQYTKRNAVVPLSGPSIKEWGAGLIALACSLGALISARIRGVRTLVYSIDKKPQGKWANDFRLNELYSALDQTSTPYLEMLHSLLGRNFVSNLYTRRRLAWYLSASDWLSWVRGGKQKEVSQSLIAAINNLALEEFFESDRRIVRALLTSIAHDYLQVPARVRMLRIIMRLLRIHSVYLIDDAYHYFEILCAAHLEKIFTSAIQHGHYTKYQVGLMPYAAAMSGVPIIPDTLVVWSEYWKKELGRLGSVLAPEQIIVGGVKDVVPPLKEKGAVTVRKKSLNVLIPYETDAPKKEMKNFIDALASHGCQFIFKPRSDIDCDTQFREYFSPNVLGDITVEIVTDSAAALAKSDVVLGTYSTFLYDAVGHCVPVLMADTLLDYGEGMIANGLAIPITNDSASIGRALEEALTIPWYELRQRYVVLYGEERCLLSDTLRNHIVNNSKS